jgi:hypothetical protein
MKAMDDNPKPRPLSLPEKLQAAKRDLDKWSKVAALPELSSEAREWVTGAARSAAAAAKLYERALAWEKMSPEQRAEEAAAHEQKMAKFAVPLTNFIERRELSKARRAETVRWLIEQALSP